MKMLTIQIQNTEGKKVAWARMSSARQLEVVTPEVGGELASKLLLPTEPSDITTLGCLAAAAAQGAGLEYSRVWEGKWEMEHSDHQNRDEEKP